jgi:hypothetical protein
MWMALEVMALFELSVTEICFNWAWRFQTSYFNGKRKNNDRLNLPKGKTKSFRRI